MPLFEKSGAKTRFLEKKILSFCERKIRQRTLLALGFA